MKQFQFVAKPTAEGEQDATEDDTAPTNEAPANTETPATPTTGGDSGDESNTDGGLDE